MQSPSDHSDEAARPALARPFAWVLAIMCLAYLPLFLGQILFFRDIAHWSFPARAFLRESLLAGEFPAWNPYQGLGFPVFGDPLYGVFYPPNWLFALVGPGHVASMLNWQAFAHMAWGAAGVCWLARRLGASGKAIVVAGLAWALSGYTTAQWTSGLLLFAGAWVPWAAAGHVVLLDRLRDRGDERRGIVLAALPTIFAVLLGEVFLAAIGAGFGIIFAYALHWGELRRPRPAWLLRSVAAVALAFGVGGVVLVPARTLLGGSERAAPLSRENAEACSLHPLRVAEFALPRSMGDAYGDYPAASVIGEKQLDGLPLSYSVYFGAGALALALAALGRRRAVAGMLAMLAGLALLLAFGKHTPVHGIFRQIVLPLAYMRYPEKYTVLVVLVVALLAGLGAQRLLTGERQPWRRTALLALVIVSLGVLARVLLPLAWAVYAIHGAVLATLAVLGVLAAQALLARGSKLASVLLVAIVALDLAVAAWPLQGFGPREIASGAPPAATAVLGQRTNPLAPPRLYRSNQTDAAVRRHIPASNNADGEFRLVRTLITNTVNAWGIATVPGYDAAIPASLGTVWDHGMASGHNALRLLGADWAVLPAPEAGSAKNDQVSPAFQPVMDPLPGARLYRVSHALPRVYLAGHAEVLDDDRALSRLFEPDIVAGKTVLLAPDQHATSLDQPPGHPGECTLVAYGRNRLTARCSANAPAVAIFVEQFAPGWSAFVDGHAQAIVRANVLMRALVLNAGEHEIAMEYRTPGLRSGAAVSVASIAILVGLALIGRRRKRV